MAQITGLRKFYTKSTLENKVSFTLTYNNLIPIKGFVSF